jgi:aspartate/methionine/tyrosine aminotransferase
VIADEAYEDLVYDGEHVSIASLPGMAERTITCFTFSKTYAMTGWRAGYAVAKEPFMTALRKIVLYSTNGVATPVQYAMIQALTTPESEIARIREEYRKRRDLLVAGLNEVGLECDTAGGRLLCFSQRGEDPQEQPHSRADPAWKRRTSPPFPVPFSARRARAICASATRSHRRKLKTAWRRCASSSR